MNLIYMVFKHITWFLDISMHISKVHDLAMVVTPMLQCSKFLLPITRQAWTFKTDTHVKLKNPKRKGMPSHSLPSLAHTYTL